MERLGNKKSAVVVTALNEYLEKHPELETGTLRIKIEDKSQMRRAQLEEMIRTIVLEQLNQGGLPKMETTPIEQSDSLQQDIAAMLDNLDFFR